MRVLGPWAAALALFLAVRPAYAQGTREATGPAGVVLEIRSYNLKSGARDDFHRRFERDSLPLLRRRQVDVVAYGPSQHDRDSYYLMRTFPDLTARERTEGAFYSSPEWLSGPRAAVLAAIDSYTTVVIRVDDATLRGLRRTMTHQNPAADLDQLARLNDAYIEAVTTSNVQRFEEILAIDFLCTLPDGTLIDRPQFLQRTAAPSTIGNLKVRDVNVRLLGDVAIVHAATTFTSADGKPGSGRYTDVWARREGKWLVVAAQFARN